MNEAKGPDEIGVSRPDGIHCRPEVSKVILIEQALQRNDNFVVRNATSKKHLKGEELWKISTQKFF
ncbi:hypothetical protein J7L68_05445 [bacterium]|nr:hypothetical protein [bacterium]